MASPCALAGLVAGDGPGPPLVAPYLDPTIAIRPLTLVAGPEPLFFEASILVQLDRNRQHGQALK
jgi:hypothetical protein